MSGDDARFHDWTAEPIAIRLLRARQLRAHHDEPLAGGEFADELERTSTAEERREVVERLRRIRSAA